MKGGKLPAGRGLRQSSACTAPGIDPFSSSSQVLVFPCFGRWNGADSELETHCVAVI
jgi:hypothetical protein